MSSIQPHHLLFDCQRCHCGPFLLRSEKCGSALTFLTQGLFKTFGTVFVFCHSACKRRDQGVDIYSEPSFHSLFLSARVQVLSLLSLLTQKSNFKRFRDSGKCTVRLERLPEEIPSVQIDLQPRRRTTLADFASVPTQTKFTL